MPFTSREASIAEILGPSKAMAQPERTPNGPALLWRLQRIRNGERREVDDPVILEEPLEIVLNGQPVAVLMRMPGDEKELAAGFCLSEGYVRDPQDILLIHHCGRSHPAPTAGGEETFDSRNRVTLRVVPEGLLRPCGADVVRLIRSGCGAAQITALADELPTVDGSLSVHSSTLLGLGRAMRERQTIHREVGGTHAAALFRADGRMVAIAEDIGRHNAVDKVIGHCLLRGTDLAQLVMVTSGRASYEMAAKAIRVAIPLVASVSAPTALAVQLAQDRGLTLIGYLRGSSMNVYTHPQRVVGA
jgi:FdhD protein